MPTLSRGVSKKLAYKKESSWGTIAGASGAKYLRRVTGQFNLTKETYQSNEIRTDFQIADFRHGVRAAEGSLNGELSPGSYADFMQSVVARDFTTGATTASMSVTIAASGSLFTLTRSAGSYITDGLFVGNIIRLTGAGLNAANVANNALIVALTATVATVRVLSGTPFVAEGPIATVTATATGKQTYAPLTGHTDDSYTVEEWFSDVAQSEVYTGVKVGSVALQLPSTGLVTCDFSFMGKNLEQTGTSQYFTSPTAAPTTGIFAAVNGALVVNGTPVAVITSADFTIERGLEAANVVGSNFAANVFTGRIQVTGNFSTFFQDANFRDYFNNETAISVVMALTADNSPTAASMSFVMPKVKLGSSTRNDGENGLIQDHSFQALLNDVTSTGLPATTVFMQDTTL